MKRCRKERKNRNHISVVKLIVIDILCATIMLSAFGLYFYVIPRALESGEVIADISSTEENSFNISSDETETAAENTTEEEENTTTAKSNGRGHNSSTSRSNTNTTDIASTASDIIDTNNLNSTLVNQYEDDNVKIEIDKYELNTDSDKVTYYAADIYVSNLSYFKTALAEGTYGKNIKDTVDDMAEDNNAILAINGDFYGNTDAGTVIRNGVLYRDDIGELDVCILYTDGTMETYSPDEFNAEEVIANGAWQGWCFGPALLDGDGNILSSFNTNSYINEENPRTAIGYIEAGHYIFVVVDGRDEGYSCGVTLSGLASIMADLGCKTAYNLDGGNSSAMYFQGEYINNVSNDGREVSDIVYIGE